MLGSYHTMRRRIRNRTCQAGLVRALEATRPQRAVKLIDQPDARRRVCTPGAVGGFGDTETSMLRKPKRQLRSKI